MRRWSGCLGALAAGSLALPFFLAAPSARAQAVGFQPVPAPLPSGVMLNVTPAVSADRRYVRLSIGASFQTIEGFTTYSVPAAVSGGGAGMNGPLGAIPGLGGIAGAGGGAGAARPAGLLAPAPASPPPPNGFSSSDPFEQALLRSTLADPAVASLPAQDSSFVPPTYNPRSRRRSAARHRSVGRTNPSPARAESRAASQPQAAAGARGSGK